jgi:acylphosphatase
VAAGVKGWVRNNQDGTVEAALEGDPDAVSRLIAWMNVGPSHAVVTNVDVREEAPAGDASFVVR